MEACSFRFWKVTDEERAEMTIPLITGFEDGRYGFADVPLMVEDLLCRVEEQRRLGVSVLPSAPQILLRCPSCGADLQERSVSLMTWRKGALVRESASLCKYCRGTLP